MDNRKNLENPCPATQQFFISWQRNIFTAKKQLVEVMKVVSQQF
jgi:hypothetical protein